MYLSGVVWPASSVWPLEVPFQIVSMGDMCGIVPMCNR